MSKHLNNSPLQNALAELQEGVANNWSQDELEPIFEKIDKEAQNASNLTHTNARSETGIGALLRVFNEMKQTAKSDARYVERVLAKIGENKVRADMANQNAAKAVPMTTFDKMKAKISLSQTDKNKMLFDSVRRGDEIGIDNALKIGANIEARTDKTGDTPLILASRVGQMSSVIALMDANANVNAQNYAGENALHVVCPGEWIQNSQGRDNHLVQLLCSANVDVNAITIHGQTPLMTAETIEVAETLSKNGTKYDQATQEAWRNEGKEELAREFQYFYAEQNPVFVKTAEQVAKEAEELKMANTQTNDQEREQ